MNLPNEIRYQVEPTLSADEFIGVLEASTLAARRPVADRPCIDGMLAHADLIVTARAAACLVGVARSVTDFHYCCYLSDLGGRRPASAAGDRHPVDPRDPGPAAPHLPSHPAVGAGGGRLLPESGLRTSPAGMDGAARAPRGPGRTRAKSRAVTDHVGQNEITNREVLDRMIGPNPTNGTIGSNWRSTRTCTTDPGSLSGAQVVVTAKPVIPAARLWRWASTSAALVVWPLSAPRTIAYLAPSRARCATVS